MRGNTFNNAEILAELNNLEDGVRTVDVQVDGPLDCNDGNLLRQWTLEGLGLQWRSLWEISDDLAAARLVTALDDFVSPESDVMAVYPLNICPGDTLGQSTGRKTIGCLALRKESDRGRGAGPRFGRRW